MSVRMGWDDFAPQNPAMNGEHHGEGCPSHLLAGLTWPGLQMVGLQMEQMGGCRWGGMGGRCSWGRWETQMEGCKWGGADGVHGGMQMGTDTDGAGGRVQIGQMGDADGAGGGIQMGTDAENPCPPLRRHGGEGGAAAWLSTLPPFAKQSQAVFQLRFFFF